jgi:hypothetical protein
MVAVAERARMAAGRALTGWVPGAGQTRMVVGWARTAVGRARTAVGRASAADPLVAHSSAAHREPEVAAAEPWAAHTVVGSAVVVGYSTVVVAWAVAPQVPQVPQALFALLAPAHDSRSSPSKTRVLLRISYRIVRFLVVGLRILDNPLVFLLLCMCADLFDTGNTTCHGFEHSIFCQVLLY